MTEKIRFGEVTKEIFINSLTELKEDGFAKTFLAKCNMMNIWHECYGIFVGGELACAIIVTVSKRVPTVANLQLIHTFFKFRNRGYAKRLTEAILADIMPEVQYLRVSAEKTAIGFYERLGFKFLGEQKSGTQLSMCKVTSFTISECEFNIEDPVINKEVYRKGRGGCVKVFTK